MADVVPGEGRRRIGAENKAFEFIVFWLLSDNICDYRNLPYDYSTSSASMDDLEHMGRECDGYDNLRPLSGACILT